MAKFPIRYAEQMPSGAGQNVRAGLNTQLDASMPDTGAAQMWGQLSDAGKQLANMGLAIREKLGKAEDMAELNGLRRKTGELWNAFQMTANTSDNPDEVDAAYGEYRKQVTAIPIKSPRVREQFDTIRSTEETSEDAAVQLGVLKIRRNNLKVASDLANAHDYRYGKAEAFAVRVDAELAAGMITTAERDNLVATFPTMSALTQMEWALSAGDVDGVDRLSATLDASKMTPEQRDRRAGILNASGQVRQQQKQAVYAEWTGMAASARDLPAQEKRQVIEQIRTQVNAPENARRMSTEELRAFNSFLDRMGKGEEWDSDTMLYGDLMTEAMGLQDASPATMQAFRAKIDQALVNQQLSSTDHRGLLKMATEKGAIPSASMAGTINSAVASLVANGLVDDAARLKYDVAQEVKEKGLTEKEAYELTFVKASGEAYKVVQEEKMAAMPQEKISDALAALNAHTSDPSDPKSKAGYAIETKQDAIDYLVNTGIWHDPRMRKSDRVRLARAVGNIYGKGGKWPEPLDKPPARKTSTSFPGGIPEQGAMPVVKTDAERDALPSGTVYIDPNGDKRTKS